MSLKPKELHVGIDMSTCRLIIGIQEGVSQCVMQCPWCPVHTTDVESSTRQSFVASASRLQCELFLVSRAFPMSVLVISVFLSQAASSMSVKLFWQSVIITIIM